MPTPKMSVPDKYTGQAAMKKQEEPNFDLKEYSYAPRKFTEDDVIIKIECCGICGVSYHYHLSLTIVGSPHDHLRLVGAQQLPRHCRSRDYRQGRQGR